MLQWQISSTWGEELGTVKFQKWDDLRGILLEKVLHLSGEVEWDRELVSVESLNDHSATVQLVDGTTKGLRGYMASRR